MATKKLDATGLRQVWAKITSIFDTKESVNSKVSAKADKSTTLSGYGITNAYTKTETDTKVGAKADKATSLSGYGITDAYTKTETDTAIKNAVAGVYKFKGSVAFASLPTSGMSDGDTYNITDEFTTNANFKEGTGHTYPAGTNVSYIGSDKKWDCLAGIYDFSDYLKASDLENITESEIDDICVIS
jgi:phage-related tail fiber protein